MVARRDYNSEEEDEYYDNTLAKTNKKLKVDETLDETLMPTRPITGSY